MTKNVNTPAKITSDGKWAPAITRITAMPTPSASEAPYARARHCGGANAAGAIVQNAPDTSPDTNAQLDGQLPRGSHQATKRSLPPNCVTSIGRGRPQWSLRSTLTSNPGAKIIVPIKKTTARPGTNSLRRGKISLLSSASNAGATSAVPIQRPTFRAIISGG